MASSSVSSAAGAAPPRPNPGTHHYNPLSDFNPPSSHPHHRTTSSAGHSPRAPADTMASVSPTGGVAASRGHATRPSPDVPPKNVAFTLLFRDSPQRLARLPMRVSIFPHDDTESIVTTVKNFYGLYSGPTGSKGVSFEDEDGNTLIARYENFRNNMVVHVRVIEEPPVPATAFGPHTFHSAPAGSHVYYDPDGFPLQPQQRFGGDISRPTSRTSRRRSPSPNGPRGRRSASASTNPTAGKRSRARSARNRDASSHTQADGYSDSVNGYSSGDGALSVTSGRTKEHLGNTEISVENIVEGGRRKRAKFESSELPLFAPPQMPAATSNASVSPARRNEHHRPSLPFIAPGQNPFANPRPLQSPHTYNNGYGQGGVYATPGSDSRRTRGSFGYPNQGLGIGILPTPDPTVGSCMSEEDKDVAIQLMRLGEMSNISHGRTSASTLDDTFSGRADAASSTGATSDADSDSEADLPPARRQKLDASGAMRKVYPAADSHFAAPGGDGAASGDDADYEDAAQGESKPTKMTSLPASAKPRNAPLQIKANKPKPSKTSRPPIPIKAKKISVASAHGPISPASLPPSRKPSLASIGHVSGIAGEDDQPDLSTKPRCQRCRKSKKGCDRQRPCGRCKDAGLGADQCISEDEGNGRKGRYGRHMGIPVSVKKEETPILPPPVPISVPALLPSAPISAAPIGSPGDKNKKRKR